MKDLKGQADASNQKHLQELNTQLKEKEAFIKKLQAKLKEAEVCKRMTEFWILVYVSG